MIPLDPVDIWQYDINDRITKFETVTDNNGRIAFNYLVGPNTSPGTETVTVDVTINGQPVQLEITITRTAT